MSYGFDGGYPGGGAPYGGAPFPDGTQFGGGFPGGGAPYGVPPFPDSTQQPGFGAPSTFGQQGYDITDTNVFGPGDPLEGYPKSILIQRSGNEDDGGQGDPIQAGVDKADLQKSMINLLESNPEVGKASAGNAKLIKQIKKLAAESASEAAREAATSAADKVAKRAYLERQTLIPPNENLSLLDINLVESFVRNPGTGPFLLLFMIFGYGGLVEEKSESKKEEDKKSSVRKEENEILLNAMMTKSQDIAVEQVFKFLGKAGDGKGGDDAGAGVSVNCGALFNTAKAGLNSANAKSALDGMETMEITTPYHIAVLPFAMLFVQFAYIFFIFYEGYKGYTGGTCPGYNDKTSSIILDPDGGDAAARILMGFIAAFFCVRVLQQLLLFAHALEGQHTDGGMKTSDNSKGLYCGFIPVNFQTWESIRQGTENMIKNARNNLPKGTIENPPQIPNLQADVSADPQGDSGANNASNKLNKATEFEKGIGAYVGAIYEQIRNLDELAYGSEQTKVNILRSDLNQLEEQLVRDGYISVDYREVVRAKAALRSADNKLHLSQRKPDVLGWRNVKWSWLLPFYIADCICQLLLLICVFLVNLYIVFIDGVAARDMVLNVVLLDFIYEQLPKFKQHVFKSDKAKALLRTLKIAHNDPPRNVVWKMQCRFAKSVGLQLIMLVSCTAFLISFCVIIYGPMCKPGANKAGTLPVAKGN